jgi:hypothetical protein
MPIKDKEAFNAYQRQYQIARYHRWRNAVIERLGGKCASCRSQKDLQLDHIDSRTKTFNFAKLWGLGKEKIEAELAKAQLLCGKCHEDKSIADAGKKKAKGNHGTTSSYRYCRCELCKKAKHNYYVRRKEMQSPKSPKKGVRSTIG